MAAWRLGRGWTETELEDRLDRLRGVGRNFPEPVDEIGRLPDWSGYSSESVIARGRPGPPEADGPFAWGRSAITNYEFSDPRIVVAHFDPDVPLEGRRMLLEMRALRALHYLGGVVVGAVRSEAEEDESVFGFRYDTLEGHIGEGAEWFLLTKDHASGELRFRIEASWRPGQFPNWWSRLGFDLLGQHYQRLWYHRAHAFMAERVRLPLSVSEVAHTRRPVHAPPNHAPLTSPSIGIIPAMSRSTTPLAYAAGMGAIAGMRSMAAPALLSRTLAWHKRPWDHLRSRSAAVRLLASPRSATMLTALAAGEMIADKTPAVPARTVLPSLVGRAASGALCGAVVAARRGGSQPVAVVVGAAAAVGMAHLAYRLRKSTGEAAGVPDLVLALVEDAIVLTAGRRLSEAV